MRERERDDAVFIRCGDTTHCAGAARMYVSPSCMSTPCIQVGNYAESGGGTWEGVWVPVTGGGGAVLFRWGALVVPSPLLNRVFGSFLGWLGS